MRTVGLSVLLPFLMVVSAFAGEVVVDYLGHSCFTIQAEGGPLVMIDPYGSYVPYPALPAPADIVLMTHAHIDHCPYCYRENDRVQGDPIIVHLWDDAGRCREKLPPASWIITEEFRLHAIEATHVTSTGDGQGWVCLFSFEVGGIQFAHLADLGRTLSDTQIDALRDVEVLFLPVGGGPTIDAVEAMTVIGQLPSVRVVFPMHYFVTGFTPTSWSSIQPLDVFAALAGATYEVRDLDESAVALDSDALPRSVEVWVPEFRTD